MPKADVGLIGLAVMGKNLARNIAGKNFHVVVFNRTTEKTEEFIKEFGGKNLSGSKTLKEFVSKLECPRKIILMVQAGPSVDEVIKNLLPLLDKNDIVIDCGNSHYLDTKRRFVELSGRGINFVGCGVSGGEEGALKGPSIMPGGDKNSYAKLKNIFEKIAAKDFSKKPCVTHVGPNGAGHFVKMVHNGIEYGVMQIIAEGYDILRSVYKLRPSEIAKIFESYNKGKLKSYLFEIAEKVLSKEDEFKKGYLVDHILDKASQKGTGKWTAIESLSHDIELPTITEAVFARLISSKKDQRKILSKIYKSTNKLGKKTPLNKFVKTLESAFYSSILSTYAQGYALIQRVSREEKWDINLSEISRIWEGGCIIRAEILKTLHKAYSKNNSTKHLFEIKEISTELKKTITSLRETVALATFNGTAIPALMSALSYFEGITKENSSANFIQGLRDYFGAHTYERTDRKGTFHTHW